MAGKQPREPDPRPAKARPAKEGQGEGDYLSSRKYQKHQPEVAEDENLVERKALLDSVEGEELDEAVQAAQRGRTI